MRSSIAGIRSSAVLGRAAPALLALAMLSAAGVPRAMAFVEAVLTQVTPRDAVAYAAEGAGRASALLYGRASGEGHSALLLRLDPGASVTQGTHARFRHGIALQGTVTGGTDSGGSGVGYLWRQGEWTQRGPDAPALRCGDTPCRVLLVAVPDLPAPRPPDPDQPRPVGHWEPAQAKDAPRALVREHGRDAMREGAIPLFGAVNARAPTGMLLSLAANSRSGALVQRSDFVAVGVRGTAHLYPAGAIDRRPPIEPGAVGAQAGGLPHSWSCEAGEECLLFLYLPKGFSTQRAPTLF